MMDHTTSWVAQHFRDRMTQAQIDEALVLAIEADKREIERLRADLTASQARIETLEQDAKSGDYETLYAQTVNELAEARRQMQAGWIEVCQSGADLLQKDLTEKLAASQAREKVLREALEWYAISEDGNRRFAGLKAARALALPADDTALREMLARAQEEMRERCIEEVRCVGGIDAIEVERLIRALEVKP